MLGLGIDDDEPVLGREVLDHLNRRRAPRGPAQVHDHVVDADVKGRDPGRKLGAQFLIEGGYALIHLAFGVSRGSPAAPGHGPCLFRISRGIHCQDGKVETHATIMHRSSAKRTAKSAPPVISAVRRAGRARGGAGVGSPGHLALHHLVGLTRPSTGREFQ